MLRSKMRGMVVGTGAQTFVHASLVGAPAAEVFRWHERAEAVRDLTPFGRWTRIERSGGLENGARVTLSLGLGSWRVRWTARHYGYVRGVQFCDEQVRGPFACWRHTHRFEAIGSRQCRYEDRIEYALPGGRVLRRLADPLLRLLLSRLFAYRHRVVRSRWAAPVPSAVCANPPEDARDMRGTP